MRSESGDRYSERTRTETFGLEVRPVDSLLLRSTFSTAFRPLLTYSSVQSPLESQQYISDPLNNPDEWYPVDTYLRGGIPAGLGPETSKTTTLGLLYRHSSDWSISVTYWDLEFRDRIATLSLETLINNEGRYPGRVRRDPASGLIDFIDARQVNIAKNDTAGIDIAADGYWSNSFGEFRVGVAATYTRQHEQQLTEFSPVISSVSIQNRDGWAPRWKVVPRLEWQPKEWISTMVVGRYVSRYKASTAFSTGTQAGTYGNLGEFWIVDLNADLSLNRFLGKNSIFENSKLSMGATNLFNQLPKFCASCGFIGYDAAQYDVLGRNVYAELRMSF